MAKIIKYQLATNTSTDEIILIDVSINCPTEKAFDANLPIVQAEAYDGVYTVEGEFDSEPVSHNDDLPSVWDELDAAYQKGVDSV